MVAAARRARATRRRPVLNLIVALSALGALASGAGCGADPALQGPTPAKASTVTVPPPLVVHITALAFDPPVVTVTAGQSVIWSFEDGVIPHNVIGPGFASPTMATGRFTQRFTAVGEVAYTCRLHKIMRGLVKVIPAP